MAILASDPDCSNFEAARQIHTMFCSRRTAPGYGFLKLRRPLTTRIASVWQAPCHLASATMHINMPHRGRFVLYWAADHFASLEKI
jgi:hypothetical protein